MFLIKSKQIGQTAFITEQGQTYTYSELADFSFGLYSQINHRCLVFCLCDNSFESVAAYVSFFENKVVPLLLDTAIDSELLLRLISIYHPEYIWLPCDRIDEFPNGESVFQKGAFSLIRFACDTASTLYPDMALLLTTSGSTGSPKLVRLSYDNVLANAQSISEYLGITEADRPITTLPMHYSFGLSIINCHLLKGATVLLTNRSLMEKEFWTFLKEQKATTLSGVPYTYEILKRLRLFRMDLPSLKTLTQAGGKMNLDLNREYAEYALAAGKRFFVMYGQTEATARMSYLPSEQVLSKLGSIGIAIPGGKFHLVDEQRRVISEAETVGELVYTGANVSLGYAEYLDDLAKEDENKGILYTGDLAKRDADSYYYIVGRKKRFVKLFGNRVNLDETERLLKNLLADCACAGRDDEMQVFITDANRQNEVKKYLAEKTGINHTAFKIIVIAEIPKNSSGKTIYSKLEVL